MWEPIDTAPKDGAWILVCMAGVHPDGFPYVPAVAKWCHVNECWTESTEEASEDEERWSVTHWQHLPEPPHA